MKSFFVYLKLSQAVIIVLLVTLFSATVVGQSKDPMRAVKDIDSMPTKHAKPTKQDDGSKESAKASYVKEVQPQTQKTATEATIRKNMPNKKYAYKKKVKVIYKNNDPQPKTLSELQQEIIAIQDKIAYVEQGNSQCANPQEEINELKGTLQKIQAQINTFTQPKK